MKRAGEAPKLWRKNRGGKAYGCWLITVAGADVNLNTKSAEIARGRLAAALKGKKDGWPSDAELAAAALEGLPPAGAPAPGPAAPEASAGAPAVVPDGVIPPGNPTTSQANSGQNELPRALPPSPAAPPPAAPGAAPAQSEQEARAEAEATNAAAAETAGKEANDGPDPASPFNLGPDAIRGLLAQAGSALVEVQLQLQAWLVFKRTGKISPPIAADSPIRDLAAQCWGAQFERWFPDMSDVAPWLLAVGLPAMALPAQFMGAQPPPPNPAENGPSAGAAPPAAQAEQAAA